MPAFPRRLPDAAAEARRRVSVRARELGASYAHPEHSVEQLSAATHQPIDRIVAEGMRALPRAHVVAHLVNVLLAAGGISLLVVSAAIVRSRPGASDVNVVSILGMLLLAGWIVGLVALAVSWTRRESLRERLEPQLRQLASEVLEETLAARRARAGAADDDRAERESGGELSA